MVITILAEPRSGSTNLAKWFSINKDFTVLFEPFNSDMKTSKWYKFGESPTLWKYDTKHFLIKEIYNKTNTQLDELISISDKIIILYREDIKTQIINTTCHCAICVLNQQPDFMAQKSGCFRVMLVYKYIYTMSFFKIFLLILINI